MDLVLRMLEADAFVLFELRLTKTTGDRASGGGIVSRSCEEVEAKKSLINRREANSLAVLDVFAAGLRFAGWWSCVFVQFEPPGPQFVQARPAMAQGQSLALQAARRPHGQHGLFRAGAIRCLTHRVLGRGSASIGSSSSSRRGFRFTRSDSGPPALN